MKYSIAFAAVAALPMAAALQQSTSGGAKIVNYCDFDIPMEDVPAMKSGVTNGAITSKTLKANNVGDDSTYFTPWVALDASVQGGWSMKLDTLGNTNDIMQSEYTWHGTGTQVWYDMSFVNGVEANHPAWRFYSPQVSPEPHSGAYQYASDDANGMQVPIDPTVVMTLQLCPPTGSASTATAAQSVVSSTIASAATVVTTSSAPAATTAAVTTTTAPAAVVKSSSTTTVRTTTTEDPSTTLATAVITPAAKAVAAGVAANSDPEIVTEYATVVVTVLATETADVHSRLRRHEHRHPHGRR